MHSGPARRARRMRLESPASPPARSRCAGEGEGAFLTLSRLRERVAVRAF